MVPTALHSPRSSRLTVTFLAVLSQHVPNLARKLSGANGDPTILHTYAKRASSDPRSPEFIVFACLIPVLVLLSGVFAGLTLGYMSLDETQLNVLSISGTPEQKCHAAKIKPIRENGHLLLVTLLLANMIVNETLPIISDPVLGGGVQSIVVSTVLIVIFSEIIPQSLCTRHGLYLGAKMAGFTQVLIYLMGIVAWPVAKLLEFVLGPHHGIIYRRAELKELIAMHSSISAHGGDLKTDTVTIIGATLDLQEKVVKQAMTPIEHVFMLSIDSKLDYETMKKVCLTGHSRVPVYEEVEVAVDASGRQDKVKKIIGILLVKHCVMLDPKDAVPLRKIPLNKVPFVPNNESLLGILDRFQEGRSHMAIVSRFSVEKATSVKKVAKRTLTQRLRERVGISDSSSDTSESSDEESVAGPKEKARKKNSQGISWADDADGDSTIRGEAASESNVTRVRRSTKSASKFKRHQGQCVDVEMGIVANDHKDKQRLRLPKPGTGLEQSMPADALLTKKDAKDFLQNIDPAIMPLGIITLEDVLEELIGEEIYDEFDCEGANGTISSYVPSEPSNSKRFPEIGDSSASIPQLIDSIPAPLPKSPMAIPVVLPLNTRGLNFLRSKSAPPSPRDDIKPSSILSSSTLVNLPTLAEPYNVNPTANEEGRISMITNKPTGIPPQPATETDLRLHTPRATAVKKRALSGSGIASPLFSASSTPASVVGSRSGSPAPSLEAILLERKRRLAAAAANGKDMTPIAPSTISTSSDSRGGRAPAMRVTGLTPKGMSKFKSSPLGGGENNAVVVAEKVKQDIKDQDEVEIEIEEIRILDEMDKAAPDKEEDDSGYL